SMNQIQRNIKESDLVALRIQTEIRHLGWPVGLALGSETELREKYGVSRGPLREGIRHLERLGLVVMEPGRNGGLRTTRPSPEPTLRRALLYFDYLRLRDGDVREVQQAVDLVLVELAVARVARDGTAAAAPLQAALQLPFDAGATRHAIAATGGNRLAGFLIDLLARLRRQSAAEAETETETTFRRLAAAIESADLALARR